MACKDSTLLRRFQTKASIDLNNPASCWLWTGHTNPQGYGRIGTSRGSEATHRVAYELFVGPVPEGLLVLHRCDVPSCVNPNHLFVGTILDNMADMTAKGRANRPKGEKQGRSKLTDVSVRLIRTRGLSDSEFAKLFGVSIKAVWLARTNKTWKHI